MKHLLKIQKAWWNARLRLAFKISHALETWDWAPTKVWVFKPITAVCFTMYKYKEKRNFAKRQSIRETTIINNQVAFFTKCFPGFWPFSDYLPLRLWYTKEVKNPELLNRFVSLADSHDIASDSLAVVDPSLESWSLDPQNVYPARWTLPPKQKSLRSEKSFS